MEDFYEKNSEKSKKKTFEIFHGIFGIFFRIFFYAEGLARKRPKGAKKRVFSKIAFRESVDFAHIAHESSFLRFQHPSTWKVICNPMMRSNASAIIIISHLTSFLRPFSHGF